MPNTHATDWASLWRQGRPRAAAEAAHRAHAEAITLDERLDALAGLVGTGESETAHQLLEVLRRESMPSSASTALAMHAHQLGEQATGLALCRAAADARSNPLQNYLHGTLAMFCGETDEAERMLERCLHGAPNHAGAHWTISQLRRWTPERHHLARLQRALAACPPDGGVESYLWFALFKELDDLRHSDAWTALVRGSLAKRRTVAFDGNAESRLVDALIEAFPATDSPPSDVPRGRDAPTPIFVIGMPRSGTTLLERILGGHSRIMACGELMDFPRQLQWSCDRIGSSIPDAAMASATTCVDHGLLGARYRAQTAWRADGKSHYTDKLPRNFWNAGCIARALPGAPILHMVRDPMDTCFSNLKELFGSAYGYSYNLTELGEHYRRYKRLMAHWHAAMPGRILDVSYEDLVRDPEAVARKALAHCQLEWDPACLSIEGRSGVVATASTVQVRAPIHQHSLGGWRRYERALEPLRQQLLAG